MSYSVYSPLEAVRFRRVIATVATLLGSLFCCHPAYSQSRSADFDSDVKPLLEQYCSGCHGYGGDEGNFTLESLSSADGAGHDAEAWWNILKNVRADVMPPAGDDQPTDAEKRLLSQWISDNVFAVGRHPNDPGPTVLRRLNRSEYRNTIRDLIGVDFNTSIEFPPDDTGNGFDNNADALSISPLLAEKYIEAATKIVDVAVPKTSKVMPVEVIKASDFKTDPKSKQNRLSFENDGSAKAKFQISKSARYRLVVPVNVRGSFKFHPAKAKVRLLLDGRVLHEADYGWNTDLKDRVSVERKLDKGQHTLEFELSTVEDSQGEAAVKIEAGTFVRLQIQPAEVKGPLDPKHWNPPDGYDRFFPMRQPPSATSERRKYATRILRKFCMKAFRRPVEEAYLNQLLDFAGFRKSADPSSNESVVEVPVAEVPADEAAVDAAADSVSDVSFEQRIAKAMTAVLASPRFLFRVDQPVANSDDRYPEVDDFSLASRLSYLLWSTMPDDQLFELAKQGKLRANLSQQIQRMLNDEKSERLVKNFVGQWLQTRDVESVAIDSLAALGLRDEYDKLVVFLDTLPSGRRTPPKDAPEEHHTAKNRYNELRRKKFLLESDLRADMGRETEAQFQYVLKNNVSLLELLDADYAFLNERLAKHYGIPGVKGNNIRKVALPDGSPRGGILTQGTFLIVTSNPSRTSPVKRGLFILENILGTPAPPAPAMVPELEEAAEQHEAEELTLRQLLELHRREPLCNSCHARFDPLGLAFENFTAIGTWRDTENSQPIEPGGQLISGEIFDSVTALKQVLAGPRKTDFYRCLSERLLAYAIGRSLDFGDEFALEQITAKLSRDNGQAVTLIEGVIESAPFLRMRRGDEKMSAIGNN